jgi:hypothetical protein
VSLSDLKSMIEFASEFAGKIFRRTGNINPMYHAIKATGETLILTPPSDDKDISVALIKAAFAIENIDRYVFMDEAWMVDDHRGQLGLDIEKVRREGVRNHPACREIVMFSAENRRGEGLTAKRFILRPEVGKPSLSPLEINKPFEHSEGRMVGLLKGLA